MRGATTVGRVNRETIATLEVIWTMLDPDEGGSWEVGVDRGFLVAPVPPAVHPEATFVYRFLDENGDAVWVDHGGF